MSGAVGRRSAGSVASRRSTRCPPQGPLPSPTTPGPRNSSTPPGPPNSSIPGPGKSPRRKYTPLPYERLCSIEWMSGKRLSNEILLAAERGPFDHETWKKFASRADVLSDTLTAKQVSMIFSATAKSKLRQPQFVLRFVRQHLHKHIPTASAESACGFVTGLSELRVNDRRTRELLSARLCEVLPELNANSVALLSKSFPLIFDEEDALFDAIMTRAKEVVSEFGGKELALVLCSLAHHVEKRFSSACGEKTEELALCGRFSDVLKHLCVHLCDRLESLDERSTALVANALGRLYSFYPDLTRDAVDLIFEEVTGAPMRFGWQQLAIIVAAQAKLHSSGRYFAATFSVLKPRLLISVPHMDPHAIAVLSNALAKMRNADLDIFRELHMRIAQIVLKLTATQIAMLCHAFAKADVCQPSLYELLRVPVIAKSDTMTALQISLIIYGYTHFGYQPSDLFDSLRQRITDLLQSGVECLPWECIRMLVNSLSRCGLHWEEVGEALRLHVAAFEGQWPTGGPGRPPVVGGGQAGRLDGQEVEYSSEGAVEEAEGRAREEEFEDGEAREVQGAVVWEGDRGLSPEARALYGILG